MRHEVRFLDVDSGRIACGMSGAGKPLVIPCSWVGDVQELLGWPSFRFFIDALGHEHSVVRFDRPGSGLSGPGSLPATLEAEERLLETVVEQLEAPVSLFGMSCGACSAVALAAKRPELVDRLVLWAPYANGAEITTPAIRESLTSLVRAHWGLGSSTIVDLLIPDASVGDQRAFAEAQRRLATAEESARLLTLVYDVDVTDMLEDVAAPTLVLHRRGDRAIPFALGRDAASRMRDSRFVALRGRDHFPWIGDSADVVRHMRSFLEARSRVPEPAERPREPAAFVFTDLVGSTALLEAVGDDAWHDLRDWHDRTLRELFAEHGGDEIDNAGDGFFVAFSSTEAALECAIAVQRALTTHRHDHGFAPQVRIGVHASAAIRTDGGFVGRSVNEAARIAQAASGGEILVSRETAEAIPSLACSDVRVLHLKGLADPVEVVALEWR